MTMARRAAAIVNKKFLHCPERKGRAWNGLGVYEK